MIDNKQPWKRLPLVSHFSLASQPVINMWNVFTNYSLASSLAVVDLFCFLLFSGILNYLALSTKLSRNKPAQDLIKNLRFALETKFSRYNRRCKWETQKQTKQEKFSSKRTHNSIWTLSRRKFESKIHAKATTKNRSERENVKISSGFARVSFGKAQRRSYKRCWVSVKGADGVIEARFIVIPLSCLFIYATALKTIHKHVVFRAAKEKQALYRGKFLCVFKYLNMLTKPRLFLAAIWK